MYAAHVATLRVTHGPSAGLLVEVGTELLLGRAGVDLVIDDPEMSRRHAAVRLVSGVLEVEDLGSRNGTFVNGERIDGPTRVEGGGWIRCGTTVFEVLVAERTRTGTPSDAATITDPQATKARPIVKPYATTPRPVVRSGLSPPGGAPAAHGSTGPATPVGPFSPPVRRRARAVASRSWVPTVLSFGTVIVVAIALVFYFATR